MSPFETVAQYKEAAGPVYSFANSPAIVGLLVALCAVFTVYFVMSSYTIYGKSKR